MTRRVRADGQISAVAPHGGRGGEGRRASSPIWRLRVPELKAVERHEVFEVAQSRVRRSHDVEAGWPTLASWQVVVALRHTTPDGDCGGTQCQPLRTVLLGPGTPHSLPVTFADTSTRLSIYSKNDL